VLSLPLFHLIDRSSFHDGLDVYFGSIFKVARLWPEWDVKYEKILESSILTFLGATSST
jgi:hypothetical protein